ncbi:MAG: HAD family hydrolase, partial [Betaproteobacteria bacterium]
LDNDRFANDLGTRLERSFGRAGRECYWAIFAELRKESGYADYLATLQRFREGHDNEPAFLQMSAYLLEYSFAERLYPHALEVIAHLHTLGRPVILSDGDVVFQPRKIQRSGLWEAFRGEVLIYLHKQHMPAAMQQRYPAAHYVMVDDKPHLLAEIKQVLGDTLTTVFVRQGHYAIAGSAGIRPAPDRDIACIGELRHRVPAYYLLAAAAPVSNATNRTMEQA